MADSFSLFEALRSGDANYVRKALIAEPNLVRARDDSSGISLLMQALYAREMDLAREILAALNELDPFEAAALGRLGDVAAMVGNAPGVLTSRSTDGFTVLHLAAFFAHPELVTWLVRQGAPVDAIAANPTLVRPLHSAVAAGSLRTASELLDAGADPNAEQRGGWTPLHAAAKRGDLELVELLLQRGASADRTSADGRTAADLARDGQHAHILERLLGEG